MENNNINANTINTSVPVNTTPAANQGGAKKNTGLIILTILLGLGTAGFGTAFFMERNKSGNGPVADKSDNTCVVTQDQVDNAEEGTIGDIVANYDTDKEVKDLVSEMIKYMGERRDLDIVSPNMMTIDSGSVPVKLDNGALTTVSKSFGVTVTPVDTAKVNAYNTAANDFFISKGFTKNSEIGGEFLYYFDKDNIRCGVTSSGIPFSVNCSNVNWISDEQAEFVTALYNAFVANNTDVNSMNVYIAKKSDIATSTSGKYEYIRATIASANSIVGGGYALYYREVGATEWTYVLGGNGIPSCSEFDEAATEAFTGSGFACGDNGEIKTVGE